MLQHTTYTPLRVSAKTHVPDGHIKDTVLRVALGGELAWLKSSGF